MTSAPIPEWEAPFRGVEPPRRARPKLRSLCRYDLAAAALDSVCAMIEARHPDAAGDLATLNATIGRWKAECAAECGGGCARDPESAHYRP